MEWVWDFRSAVRSSKLTADGFGPRAISAMVQPFSSPCCRQAHKRSTPGTHAFDVPEHVAAARHLPTRLRGAKSSAPATTAPRSSIAIAARLLHDQHHGARHLITPSVADAEG